MINETITWSFFYKGDTQFSGEDLGIKEDQNAPLETYLNALKKQKKRLDTEGVTRVAVFHTLLYENQCNTEFSPKILSLLLELNATFCISADRLDYEESKKAQTDTDYWDTLQEVFDGARGNPYLHDVLKSNFSQLNRFEYELWHGVEEGHHITTLIPCADNRESYLLLPYEKLALRFYAINLKTAQQINNDFIGDLIDKK